MRLDQFLVEKSFAASRHRAQLLIADGSVTVNGMTITKPSKDVSEKDSIQVTDSIKYVSRAGLKLEKALEVFNIDPEHVSCLDIGSSIGGFTDCLLAHGAHDVTCVDVGTDQLAEKIKSDERVTVFENQDIRTFMPSKQFDLIVCDASFISLKNIIPVIPTFSKPNSKIILLIKPQFEVGKEFLNRQGIVTNQEKVQEAISEILETAKSLHFELKHEIIESPIHGGDGNVEYLSYFVFSV